MDVVLLRWPEEDARLRQLRAARAPRLLLLNAASAPPESADCLEDWIRLPANGRDVGARAASLAVRAESDQTAPEVDGDGLLRRGGRWVALPPVEAALAAVLVDGFGAVVGREILARRVWPNGEPRSRALDVNVNRLRRRIAPLGIEVRTVRARGYLMEAL
jgi:two-component system, OmpR family, response regulator